MLKYIGWFIQKITTLCCSGFLGHPVYFLLILNCGACVPLQILYLYFFKIVANKEVILLCRTNWPPCMYLTSFLYSDKNWRSHQLTLVIACSTDTNKLCSSSGNSEPSYWSAQPISRSETDRRLEHILSSMECNGLRNSATVRQWIWWLSFQIRAT